MACYACGVEGHMARDCPDPKPDARGKRSRAPGRGSRSGGASGQGTPAGPDSISRHAIATGAMILAKDGFTAVCPKCYHRHTAAECTGGKPNMRQKP